MISEIPELTYSNRDYRRHVALYHALTCRLFPRNLGKSCGIHLLSSSANSSQNRIDASVARDLNEVSLYLAKMHFLRNGGDSLVLVLCPSNSSGHM